MGRRKSKPRKMLPQILVLCEGETEEAYVNMLRQNYRLPIKIISRITGEKITQNLINRHKKSLVSNSEKIDVFLIYDGDIKHVVDNLKSCEGNVLISKPCIEVWFISHFDKYFNFGSSSNSCVNYLKTITNWENYKKGVLSSKQEDELWKNRFKAVDTMKTKTGTDIFSDLYKFIDFLENINNNRTL